MSLPAHPEFAITFLLACFAKATILLTGAWAVSIALRRRSSALRHHVWAAAILASTALPFFVLLLPAWHSTALGNAAALWNPAHPGALRTSIPTVPATTVQVAASSSVAGKLALFAFLVWALGFVLMALRLFAGLGRLAWVSMRAHPLFEDDWMSHVLQLSKLFVVARSVRLLQSGSSATMPLTWGIFRPAIVLPMGAARWSQERRRIVLSHELAHIARHDWTLQICAELARALYWFHPLLWLAAARLRQESERACDDAVLLSGVAPSHYASQLLDLARTLKNSGRAWSTALAIARPSNLERRFAAMLNPSINRRHLSTRTKILVPLFAVILLLPLAALRLTAQNLAGKTSGSIHDPSGTGVANATIIMTNHEANTIDMTVSDRDGNFSFKPLPAGNYELQVLKPGFKAYRMAVVSLDAGRDFSGLFNLEVGEITEHVVVVPAGLAKTPVVEAAEGKPSRIRLGGNVEAAKVLSRVQPVYPESAKAAGIQGTVVLHAVIGKDGKPLSLHVTNGQVDPDLARSAVEAVSQWRYEPTLLNGESIEVDTTIDIVYSLQP
jgi:TonB family protein